MAGDKDAHERAGGALPTAWIGALRQPRVVAVAQVVVTFLMTVVLALRGGGYAAIEHTAAALVVWWTLLLCVIAGTRIWRPAGRLAWAGAVLLAVFVLWTAVAATWSQSPEHTVDELVRVLLYLGVLLVATLVTDPAGRERIATALGAAVAVVAVLALLSRLHPSWFPVNEIPQFLGGTEGRLSYPLNYWNGVAAFVAFGIPLLLWLATSARRTLVRALAAAVLPLMVLTLFYTFSRAGFGAAVIGTLSLLCLAPNRLPRALTTLVAAAGGALLIVFASGKDALEQNTDLVLAQREGTTVLLVGLAAAAAVGAIQAAFTVGGRRGLRPGWTRPSTRVTAAFVVVVALGMVTAGAVAVSSGRFDARWQEFKQTELSLTETQSARLTSVKANGRYQFWRASVDAWKTRPLTGVGPGTWELWWARKGEFRTYTRYAHSLLFQTMAEGGAVGFLLIVGFFLVVLLAGVRRALRGREHERALAAALTAAAAAFTVSAASDWTWNLPVVPVMFMIAAGLLLGMGREAQAAAGRSDRRAWPYLALGGAVVVVAIALLPKMAAEVWLHQSQSAVRERSFDSALADARHAGSAQPWAVSPRLQEALVLQATKHYDAALEVASDTTSKEPLNWRTWYVVGSIQRDRGADRAADRAYQRARSLNPRSPIFAPDTTP